MILINVNFRERPEKYPIYRLDFNRATPAGKLAAVTFAHTARCIPFLLSDVPEMIAVMRAFAEKLHANAEWLWNNDGQPKVMTERVGRVKIGGAGYRLSLLSATSPRPDKPTMYFPIATVHTFYDGLRQLCIDYGEPDPLPDWPAPVVQKGMPAPACLDVSAYDEPYNPVKEDESESI